MSLFFNGRLWTTPATMSAVDDSAMVNQNLSVGNVLALVGSSTGGEPNTPLFFGSPAQALATLKSGELCQAVMKAFSPSDEVNAPAQVVAVRVNPAIQSSRTVNDVNGSPCISIESADYGAGTNNISVGFSAASVKGIKSTVTQNSAVFSQDNIYAPQFQIQYTGTAASATATINGTTLTLSAPLNTVVATIPLSQFSTIQQLVSYINSVTGFTASVIGANGSNPTLNSLDFVTAQDVLSSAFVVTANLQAVVTWLNSLTIKGNTLLVATTTAGAGKIPASIPATYLTGGSDGTTTNANWGDAFTALQAVSISWLTPLSEDQGVVAMADAHVQYMSTVGRKERRCIAGTGLNTTDTQAITDALQINSDRTSLVHLGYYDYDLTGQNTGLILYKPYMAAAVIAAAFSGCNPGTPMTNKSVTFRGLERNLLNPTETDPLIDGGVLCVESTTKGYKVVASISTCLYSTAYDKVQQSTGWALDFVCQNVRNALDALRGQKGTPNLLGRAVSVTDSTLRLLAVPEPQGPGVITGDSNSPAYKGITASLVGDVVAVSFQCSPVIGVDFIPVTVYAVPYSGTASA